MDNQNRKLELLGNAPIPKALLAMGIPTMIGMLINALYNLVDAYFVGGLGESQMAAISVVYPLGQVVVAVWHRPAASKCFLAGVFLFGALVVGFNVPDGKITA